MNEAQRALAHDLLKTGLSQRGYTQATTIMVDLENILKALENGSAMRDPGAVLLFDLRHAGGERCVGMAGERPSPVAAFQRRRTARPSPARRRSSDRIRRKCGLKGRRRGFAVLGDREDTARALLMALDPTQRTTATLEGVAPSDIVTKTAVKVDPLSPAGLAASAMTPKQRELLMAVIESYTSSMAADIASERLATARRRPGSRRSRSPGRASPKSARSTTTACRDRRSSIEYDNTQNDGNHVHSVWRDFNGDFGRDLLREHVQSVKHE